MNIHSLAQSYLFKADSRLDILTVLKNKKAYSDVVREAQEIVELCLKGMLRAVGIDPPKFHDVSDILLEYKNRFPEKIIAEAEKIAKISKMLRKERELAFYGDIDFIPTEEYSVENAEEAISYANFIVEMAKLVIK